MPKALTLEVFKAEARAKGGECLSTVYDKITTPLKFRCAKGHEWEARAANIRSGNWCPRCAGRERHRIAEMRTLALARGGECLSEQYASAHAPLRWRCSAGHEWHAAAASVGNRGSWCRVCSRVIANSKTSLGMEVAHHLAAERGGVCLTAEYPIGRKKYFRWRCADGHEWESTLMAVRHAGQWCPTCASGLGERFCRVMFERIFDAPFAKARPKWLLNERGKRMELDGFNKQLSLAFEFQGPQHYSDIAHFHQKGSLERRARDDAAKRVLCKAHEVALIEVPHTIKYEDVQEFIYDQCNSLGVTVKRKPPIELAQLDFYPSFDLTRLRDYATAKGGKCLTDYFPGMAVPVKWQCAHGHEWLSSFHEISRRDGWCPECAVNHPLSLAEMQQLAHERGGECLSTQYENSSRKLRWRCASGHEWEATGNDVRNSGSWCPHCAGVARGSIDDAKKAAAARGGQCLSDEYTNRRAKLLWRCAKGHEWSAAAGSVIGSGTWCAICSGKAKLTVEEMRAIAKERGGECLSEQYVNLGTKLSWRCAHGHEWSATPNNVKYAKAWCPVCALGRRRAQL
jgi:hypothetical protein